VAAAVRTSTMSWMKPLSVLLRISAFLEEPGLVCEYDGLDAVAEAELLEDVRDVCLDGRLADVERTQPAEAIRIRE
jgi:hypothetical protein